jgi:hypothetical protein
MAVALPWTIVITNEVCNARDESVSGAKVTHG